MMGIATVNERLVLVARLMCDCGTGAIDAMNVVGIPMVLADHLWFYTAQQDCDLDDTEPYDGKEATIFRVLLMSELAKDMGY